MALRSLLIESSKHFRAKQYANFSLQWDKDRYRWFSEMQTTAHRFESDGSRLGGYTLFNIGAEYRFNKAWRMVARINNIFNKNYTTMMGYSNLGINGVVSLHYSHLGF